MKVKELIEKLKGIDPETDVVVPGKDHSYSHVRIANLMHACKLKNGTLIENSPLGFYQSTPDQLAEMDIVHVLYVGHN